MQIWEKEWNPIQHTLTSHRSALTQERRAKTTKTSFTLANRQRRRNVKASELNYQLFNAMHKQHTNDTRLFEHWRDIKASFIHPRGPILFYYVTQLFPLLFASFNIVKGIKRSRPLPFIFVMRKQRGITNEIHGRESF